jgi:phosphoribosylamine--glycine ligase
MRILVIGGGGREHALTWSLTSGRRDVSVVCAPGNPGIAALARCRPADLTQPSELLAIAEQEQVDLTVVGPELR